MRAKALLAVMGLVLAVAIVVPVSGAFHFALSGSAPEADTAVPSPEELRLWFTQAPQDNSVAIRLIDAGGDAIDTGEPTRSRQDEKIFTVDVERPLGAGAYTVSWRGIGDDGHVVRGDFGFTVRAQ